MHSNNAGSVASCSSLMLMKGCRSPLMGAGSCRPQGATAAASKACASGIGNWARARRCTLARQSAHVRRRCLSSSGRRRTSTAASCSDRASTVGSAAPKPWQGEGTAAHCATVRGWLAASAA